MFEISNMNYELDRDPQTEPSLADMTVKAIEILQKDEDGFFLFVEGQFSIIFPVSFVYP